MRLARGFGRFWYDFIIGDDWRIATGVVLVLAVGALLVSATSLSDTIVTIVVTSGILSVVGASIVRAG
jgi:hypothetical protein